MELTRQSNETVDEYQIRLCSNKDLLNLTWPDIAKLMNAELDEDYTESRYRKWWNNFKQGYDYAIDQGVTQNEVIQEFEDKRLEFEKERYRLFDQRREYRKLVREQSRFEYIRELITKEISRMEELKPIRWSPPQVYTTKEREGILQVSDLHFGMKVDTQFNRYNTDIFYERWDSLVTQTIQFGKERGIKTLHVMNLADAISGAIHVSTRIHNTEGVTQQTIHVAEAFADMLAKFCSEFEQVKFYSTRGNHDRVNARKDEAISSESFADFIPWHVVTRIGDIPNFEYVPNTVDDEIITADVCGNFIVGVHGHKDRPQQVASNMSLMLKKVPVAVLTAHIHHRLEEESTGGVDVITNPSFCGTDEYSRDIRKTSKVAQNLLIYDKYGRIGQDIIRLDIPRQLSEVI